MPKYLSLEESKELLSAAQSISTNERQNRNIDRDYAIITLFLNCGMRLSELVGINITDIDFSENKMTVIGKGNKEDGSSHGRDNEHFFVGTAHTACRDT